MNMKNMQDSNKTNRPDEPNPSLPICTVSENDNKNNEHFDIKNCLHSPPLTTHLPTPDQVLL